MNILKASIDINLQGHMLAEVEGQSDKIGQALEYLERVGIEADFVKSTIQRIEEKCVDCGLCTTVCGSKASELVMIQSGSLSMKTTDVSVATYVFRHVLFRQLQTRWV